MRMLFVLFSMNMFLGPFAQAAILEGDFLNLISLFQKQYPDIEIQGSWDNDTVNAQAMRFDDSKLIVIYGGLARERTTTLDSFTLVVCHEVGHHLGGKPYFPSMAGVPWASGEGAADYYSIQACFNKISPKVGEQAVTLPAVYENDLHRICSDQKDFGICRRSLIAGLIIAKLQWQVLPNESVEPSLQNKDGSIVKSTLLDYGSPQCRLDTFIASATSSSRPRCWNP